MRWIFASLVFFFLFIGCEEEQEIRPPEPLLDESTYMDIFIDLKLFNAMVQSTDSLIVDQSLKQEIFEHYGVSEDVFLTNHAYYQSFPMEQSHRIDSAISILETRLDSIRKIEMKID